MSTSGRGLHGRVLETLGPAITAGGYPPVAVHEPRSPKEARRRYELALKVRRLRKPTPNHAG